MHPHVQPADFSSSSHCFLRSRHLHRIDFWLLSNFSSPFVFIPSLHWKQLCSIGGSPQDFLRWRVLLGICCAIWLVYTCVRYWYTNEFISIEHEIVLNVRSFSSRWSSFHVVQDWRLLFFYVLLFIFSVDVFKFSMFFFSFQWSFEPFLPSMDVFTLSCRLLVLLGTRFWSFFDRMSCSQNASRGLVAFPAFWIFSCWLKYVSVLQMLAPHCWNGFALNKVKKYVGISYRRM